MKGLLSLILLIIVLAPCTGQSDNIFIKDIKQADVHFLETAPITFVIRGNYTYSFQLINNEKGMQGSLISKDGVTPEKGDELIFVNTHSDRKSFEFYNYPDISKKSGRPIYKNYFFLDNEDLQWLLTYKIANFYIKKTQLMQMRKFGLPSSRGDKLTQVIQAFNDKLDRSLIIKPTVVQSDPDVHDTNLKWYPPSKSKATGNQPNVSVNRLSEERIQSQEELLAAIEEDKLKADLIRDQLREEVAQARLNAELQKEKYAKEVKKAREQSLDEIERINSETSLHIKEEKELSAKKTEELAWEVYNAKIKSAEAISRIKNRSDEKIIDHENELTNKIQELDQKYKSAQQSYTKSIEETKLKAVEEINAIRKRSQIKLDSLRTSLLAEQSSLSGHRQNELNEVNQSIYKYKEMVLDSLARMEENLARIKERNAQSIALSNKDYNNKTNLLQKENALELAELKNKMEVERSKIKVNAVQEIERYNEALRDAKEVRQNEIQLLQTELDSVRRVHESTIIAERHKLETELQSIAASVVEARKRSGEAVQMASQQSTYRISEIQNLVEERRVELLNELKEDQKKINSKRDKIQSEYVTYQQKQNEEKDSLQQYYVSTYKNLKENFDQSLFNTRTRNDSLIGVMEQDYIKLKQLYADSIQLIRSRARQKMLDIDRDNSIPDNPTTSQDIAKQSKQTNKAIVQLKADHKEKLLQEKEKLAQELVILRRNHRDHIDEIQKNIKAEVQTEFSRLKDVRLSLREEMNSMSDQFRSFKKQQQDRINDESERFKKIMAATRLDQLNELLRIDSIHNATKTDIINRQESERKTIKDQLNSQLKQIKDSLQTQYSKYNGMLDELNTGYTTKRNLIKKQEVDLIRTHNERVKISEQQMLEDISKNERISANEVYNAKQNARDEIATIKEQTLQEIKNIQSQKQRYEQELIELENQIKIKKAELLKLKK